MGYTPSDLWNTDAIKKSASRTVQVSFKCEILLSEMFIRFNNTKNIFMIHNTNGSMEFAL